MNFQRKALAVSLAYALGIGGGLCMSVDASAQQSGEQAAGDQQPARIERIEVTGSSIKRIDAEGSLPVIVIRREEIAQTGVTNIPDLIQALPAMQNFTAASASVNGGGGGVQDASIHGLGPNYTLVLLNGRRIAPYNTGSNVNLAAIPLASVERVEILTDGASAIYGSDAIAGVVNIITEQNSTKGRVEASYNKPQSSGGESYTVSASKGFGDLNKDKFNVFFSLGHDEQSELNAWQRDFGSTGIRSFGYNGQTYWLYQATTNTVPAGAILTLNDGSSVSFSPNYLQNGTCGPHTFLSGNYCRFDYASTVQLVPKDKRDSAYLSGKLKLGDNWTAFTELMYSSFSLTGRFAAPAQPLRLSTSSPLFAQYVAPYLSRLGVDPSTIDHVVMGVRVYDAGGRTDEYKTDTTHFVAGVQGTIKDWDVSASYTHSENKWYDNAAGGYLSHDAFNAIIAGGAYNPFLDAGGSVSVLAPAVLHQNVDQSKSSIDAFDARVSRPLFDLSGGAAQLGAGVDYTIQKYSDNPSAILMGQNALQPDYTDNIVGGGSGNLPFDSHRSFWGVFTEMLFPVTKSLEVTAALRYDAYSKIHNAQNFDSSGNPVGGEDQGNSYSQGTYKLAARFQPVNSFLVRGSIGTGFRAPTMGQVTSPMTVAGNTANSYNCPFAAPNPLAAGCQAPGSQYDILSGGNPLGGDSGLKPEKSDQWSIGFRVEPISSASFGLDLWNVKIKDQIFGGGIPEQVAFANPAAYQNLFRVITDPIGQFPIIALIQAPLNFTNAEYRGIDWDASFNTKTGWGPLTVRWGGTYMIKGDYLVPGLGTQTSLGQYGADQTVLFRVQSRLSASLKTGMFANTVTVNYKSGYKDAPHSGDFAIRASNSSGGVGPYVDFCCREVSPYTTVDWQTKATINKALDLTFGIKNLLDQNPPFSVQTGGGGNQVGYDGRYADPLGRQYYLSASYKF